jgi:hypothetical protein
LTFEYQGDRKEFWLDYVERAGWGVESESAYENFLQHERYLGNLFNIWANPNEDDWAQSIAYREFWDELARWGLDKDSFDWHAFKQKYKLYA